MQHITAKEKVNTDIFGYAHSTIQSKAYSEAI